MDSHDSDPKQEPTEDPWQQLSDRWASMTEELKVRYRAVADEDSPSEDEVKDALTTLGSAAQRLIDSFGDAARDPEMRDRMKGVASSFVSALGRTISDLGDELRRTRESD